MTVGLRPLGRTGLMVSEIGHGLWGMGSWSDADDDRSRGSLALSARHGCNFFDSALTYGDGRADALLGDLVRSHEGGALVAASKVPPANGKFPGSAITDAYEDLFPVEYVVATARRILASMGLPKLPLLQLHIWDDRWTDAPAFVRTVREVKRLELADHFGISLNRWEPSNGVRAVESGLVDTVQVVHNVFTQTAEDELFPACRRNGVGVIARVPLDEGSLGGTMTRTTTFPTDDWRSGYFRSSNLEQTMDRVDRLREMLPAGMSLPELAIRFVLSHPDVSTVVVGMRTDAHVRENLGFSAMGPLPPPLLAALREHRWDRAALP